MIYSLDLRTALIVTGLLLVAMHALALWKAADVRAWLQAFPRSRPMGLALLVIVAAWSWILIKTIDLGEFTHWRMRILVFIPIAAFLTWRYVDEFLAPRSLGMLVLLAAEPLLEAAFLRPEASRLFLVSLVYVAIVFGLFWIGMPYTLRDQIAWLSRKESRWRAAALTGLAYGLLLLSLPLTLHRSA
ncbi:MAG: hypothetical protein M3463_12785 [Verrucomicrobiota bacterium]|nr:hypothetical protein [Verrucomicrobiota bacterium]